MKFPNDVLRRIVDDARSDGYIGDLEGVRIALGALNADDLVRALEAARTNPHTDFQLGLLRAAEICDTLMDDEYSEREKQGAFCCAAAIRAEAAKETP